LKCAKAAVLPATVAINKVEAVKEEVETRPFALAPGSYLFIY